MSKSTLGAEMYPEVDRQALGRYSMCRRCVGAVAGAVLLVLSSTVAGQPVALRHETLRSVVRVLTPKLQRRDGRPIRVWDAIGSAVLVTDGRMLFVVTARHVVRGRDSVFIALPLVGGRSIPVKLGRGTMDFIYPADESLDLALAAVPMRFPSESLEVSVYSKAASMDPDSLSPGEPVFIVGFPLGLGGPENVPMVKAGAVSLLPYGGREFYIDASLYPGNSGGAVLTQPSLIDMRSHAIGSVPPARLLGIASRTLQWSDSAHSKQSGRLRVVFEENSDLAVITSVTRLWRFVEQKQ